MASGRMDQVQSVESGEEPVASVARAACAARGNDPSALLEVLHDVRAAIGDIPEPAIRTIADALNLSRAEVYGAKSFYHDFREPRRPGLLHVCLGEACRSRGSGALFEAAIASGLEATSVYCLGNCALSPAVMVDGVVRGRVGDVAALQQLMDGGR